MRLWNCEFCGKWNFENVNFVENKILKMWIFGKNETLKLWILWKVRFSKCEFLDKLRIFAPLCLPLNKTGFSSWMFLVWQTWLCQGWFSHSVTWEFVVACSVKVWKEGEMACNLAPEWWGPKWMMKMARTQYPIWVAIVIYSHKCGLAPIGPQKKYMHWDLSGHLLHIVW